MIMATVSHARHGALLGEARTLGFISQKAPLFPVNAQCWGEKLIQR